MKRLLFLLVVSLTMHAMNEKELKPSADHYGSENASSTIELTAPQKKYLEKILRDGFLYKSGFYTEYELLTCVGCSVCGLTGALVVPTQMIFRDMFGVSIGLLMCFTGCLGSIGAYMRRYLRSKKQSENRSKCIDEGMNTLGSKAVKIKEFLEEEHQGFCPPSVYCSSCNFNARFLCRRSFQEKDLREYCKKCSVCRVASFQEHLGLKREGEHYKICEESRDFLITVLNGIVKKTETEDVV